MAFIRVTLDTEGAMAKLNACVKQANFATAVALTQTAKLVKDDLRQEMQNSFVSAVPYTLNSLYVKAATKSDQVARVGIKTQGRSNATGWLEPEIKGGERRGGIEVFLKPAGLPPPGMYAVPGSEAPLTGANKLNINMLKKIVTQLAGQPQGATALHAMRKRRQSSKIEYFALPQAVGPLKAGIYGRRGRELLPIILFVRQPSYRKKFDFYGVGAASAQKNFGAQFKLALAKALGSAR